MWAYINMQYFPVMTVTLYHTLLTSKGSYIVTLLSESLDSLGGLQLPRYVHGRTTSSQSSPGLTPTPLSSLVSPGSAKKNIRSAVVALLSQGYTAIQWGQG